MEYKDIRSVVQKAGSDRLVAEILIAQPQVKKEDLEELTREDLVEFVSLIRLEAGQKESVKSAIVNFDLAKAREKFKKPVQGAEIFVTWMLQI